MGYISRNHQEPFFFHHGPLCVQSMSRTWAPTPSGWRGKLFLFGYTDPHGILLLFYNVLHLTSKPSSLSLPTSTYYVRTLSTSFNCVPLFCILHAAFCCLAHNPSLIVHPLVTPVFSCFTCMFFSPCCCRTLHILHDRFRMFEFC